MATKYEWYLQERVSSGGKYSSSGADAEGKIILNIRKENDSSEYKSKGIVLEGSYSPDRGDEILYGGRGRLDRKEILKYVSEILDDARIGGCTYNPPQDSVSFIPDGRLIAHGDGFDWGASAPRSLEAFAQEITREMIFRLPKAN